jgi:hypothetical protein
MSRKSIPANPKEKILREASSLTDDIDNKRFSLSDAGNLQTGQGRGQDRNEFPAQYFPDMHKEDRRIQLKADLAAAGRPLGDISVQPEDIDYLMKKEEVKELANFDNWFSHLFNTDDINTRRLAIEIYPDYYEKRKAEIYRQADIQIKLALIKLYGIKTLDDIKLLFAMQTGEVKLRNVPLYNLDEADDEDIEKTFKKGLFNPAKRTTIQDAAYGPATLGRGIFGGNLPAGLAGWRNNVTGAGVPNANAANAISGYLGGPRDIPQGNRGTPRPNYRP